ncbi:MAG: hypothetical protein ACI35Q_00050 [Marinilabiliaceae bacterium]
MPGQVFSKGQAQDAVLNVHLLHGELHSLAGDAISTVTQTVDSVVIAGAVFVPVDGMLCQVLAKSGSVAVVKKVYGDFNKLMSGTGAYGSTLSTSGRRELSSIEIGGINQTNHGILLRTRADGQFLPLKTERLVCVFSPSGVTAVDASARAVRELVPADRREQLKADFKAAKVKWGRDEGVAPVAAIVSSLLAK